MRPTRKDILNSACGPLNPHLENPTEPKKGKIIKPRNDCKEVQKMHWDLKYWCIEKGLLLVPELIFDTERKYRLDFAIMRGITEYQARHFEYKDENKFAAIEYQGGIFMKSKSGHSNAAGATRDCHKSNLAQQLNWTYFTYTALNYLHVLRDLEKLLKK